ncbi:MAG: hypothetical protein PHF35_04365 [Candidatus Moranbacteria bacterium]|nr:hypothetical protein [Candidatus Moranbacteria bacterium]
MEYFFGIRVRVLAVILNVFLSVLMIITISFGLLVASPLVDKKIYRINMVACKAGYYSPYLALNFRDRVEIALSICWCEWYVKKYFSSRPIEPIDPKNPVIRMSTENKIRKITGDAKKIGMPANPALFIPPKK